jgi:hypothetical protein
MGINDGETGFMVCYFSTWKHIVLFMSLMHSAAIQETRDLRKRFMAMVS